MSHASQAATSPPDGYDVRKDKTLKKVVHGRSPLWINIVIGILRCWFFIYDCLNYLPYRIFNPPLEKLRRSTRVKAQFLGERDKAIEHVDGHVDIDFPGQDTIDKLFRHVASIWQERPALGTRPLVKVHKEKQPDGKIMDKWELGDYEWQSYGQVEGRVGRLAAGLLELVKVNALQNDKTKVVIYAETRADWLLTALACFRANLQVVTVYATLGEDAIVGAIDETESSILVTSAELVPKAAGVVARCKTLRSVIYFPPLERNTSVDKTTIVKHTHVGSVMSFMEVERLAASSISASTAQPDDVAVIMYTSGTTGQAKGVMISHHNIVASISGQGHAVPILTENDIYIGYLPLAHILELDAELTCLSRGCRIGYSSPTTLHDRATKIYPGTKGDCAVLRPTLMAAVPAIMDRIFKAVSEEVGQTSRFMQELFRLNYERKRSRYEEGYCSPFLDRIVFRRTRALLGGRLRAVLSGGAPLNPETQRFMNICMCCPVVQGYGLTETCGCGSIADISDLSTGTVGPPVRCAKIILREWAEGGYRPQNNPPTGEILMGGPHVALGYFKMPDKTKEDFLEIDGVRYFATGDIGQLREDGSILIIDRKKDLVKLAHGEYVSLAKIETVLLNCPLVDNICVFADSKQPHTVALVVPNPKQLAKLADEVGVHGLSFVDQCRDRAVQTAIRRRLEEQATKQKLQKFELPSAYHLCEEVWTPEAGLLTEALKLKRRPLQQKYADTLKALYGGRAAIQRA